MSSNSFMWGWWMMGYIIEILYSEYYPENSNLHYEVVMVLSQHYPQRRILIIIPRYLLSLPPTQVTDSIYDLVGAEVHPRVKSQNVEKVFTSMDINKAGVVSLDEFLVYCSSSHRVQQSLAVLP